jgi:hypothetical protein
MDVKVLESQILTAQGELSQLKSTLTPCVIFINELFDIRKRRNLPDSSPYSLLSLLSLEIKGEINKDFSQKFALAEELDLIRDAISENTNDKAAVRDLIFRLEEEIKSHKPVMARLEFENKDTKEKLEELRYQLEGKSTISHFQEIKQSIKNCATVSALEMVKNRLSDCAGKYQMDEIQKGIKKCEDRFRKYLKTTEVKDCITVAKEEMRYFMEKDYLTKETFSKEKDGILRKFKIIQDQLNEFIAMTEKNEATITKKISNLKKQLDSAPWSNSITDIHNVLLDKANYEDLQKFRVEINTILNKSAETIEFFRNNITAFESIVARFDEILLIKAEKDDITKINNTISTLVEIKSFEDTYKPIRESIDKIQDAIVKLVKSADIMDKHIDSVSGKVNSLVKDKIDVIMVAKNLNDMQDTVARKANKEDIYEIYDIMGRKIEIEHVNESLSMHRKQLELSTVLLLAITKTLVKSGESPLVVQKKREEAIGSLNSLINWINGDIITIQKTLLTPKPVESFRKQCSSSLDDNYRNTASRSLRRRFSNGKNEQSVSIEFPKVKIV